MSQKNIIRSIIALVAGVVLVFAFAPFKIYGLIFISLATLFSLWLTSNSLKESFLIGWIFGLGQFGVGVSWMTVSLSTFGNMSPILAGFAVFLLIMALALFPALVGLAQHCLKSEKISIRLYFVMIPFWILTEWIREWIFTGLPWLAAGYSQTDNLLASWAPVGGIYLVSLIVLIIAATLVSLFNKKIISSVIILFVTIISSYYLSQQQWTSSDDRSLSVKLVQGNVSIWDKWDTGKTQQILDKYISLSNEGEPSDLVIWPEAAAPLLLSQLPESFWQSVRGTNNRQVMFGVVEQDSATGNLYNAVVSTQDGDRLGMYRKTHLVPFGEFLPLKFMLEWLLDYLQIPMSDFSAYHSNQREIEVNGIKIGMSICYEDAFANVVRNSLPEANVLVNVSEDAWFGDSLAPHQRLQMAQMRARENERTLIRASNNGLSSIIDYSGRILKISPQFETVVLEGNAPSRTGITPFSNLGHKLVLSILLMLLLVAFVSALLKRRTGGFNFE